MSKSLPPYGLEPSRLLLYQWNFPGKKTEVDYHYLLQGLFQTHGSNPHLLHWQADSYHCAFFREDPHLFTVYAYACVLNLSVMFNSFFLMDYSPPVSSVHVISFTQEYWSGLPFPSSGESSWPSDWNYMSCMDKQTLYHSATKEANQNFVFRL